ncbi:MAG TPA: lamin tail domain-containing protein, partial [Bacteroidota bacterium]|nr:lamin tail domain-containing protein [Bacteroidota bacterium]
GRSLERIEPMGSSTDSSNWGPSTDSLGSTPGMQNSLTPVEYDLRINSVIYVNEIHVCRITATIQNIGREPATNFSLELYDDHNEDSIPDPSELLQTQTVPAVLQQKDSMTVPLIWNNPPAGRHHLIAVIHYPNDLRLSNNVMMVNIKISYLASSVVINEIMYAPLSGQSEYIELYNPTKSPIDLREWKLTDKPDTNRASDSYTLTKNQLLFNPGTYITIASDSDIVNQFSYLHDTMMYQLIIKRNGITLNNSGDNVILYDLTGATMDSVMYSSSWQNPNLDITTGRSLEKINPTLDGTDSRNWGTSASPLGGTPGKQNSVFTNSIPANVSLSCSPNPFSPDGDGFQDVTIIQYSLPIALATIRLRIYDAMGRIVRTLADGEPAGAHGSVVWNGLSDRGERVRIGIYIILLETITSNGMTVQTVKGTVVVATKL